MGAPMRKVKRSIGKMDFMPFTAFLNTTSSAGKHSLTEHLTSSWKKPEKAHCLDQICLRIHPPNYLVFLVIFFSFLVNIAVVFKNHFFKLLHWFRISFLMQDTRAFWYISPLVWVMHWLCFKSHILYAKT